MQKVKQEAISAKLKEHNQIDAKQCSFIANSWVTNQIHFKNEIMGLLISAFNGSLYGTFTENRSTIKNKIDVT